MNTLEEHRQAIDRIDSHIIDLIAARKQAVEDIVRYKAEHSMDALQPARFQAVLDACRGAAEQKGLDPDVIEDIWNILHEYFLRIERQELSR